MILNEQTYKNLNRPYYIGRMKGYDRSKALHNNYFYLTTDLKYAILYSKYDGYVEEYRLKSGVNIFNAKSDKDYYTLRKALLDSPELNTFTKYLDDLKSEDWTVILDGYKNRDSVVNLLIDLGYDGYFNYEYTRNVIKKLEQDNEFIPVISNEPAIGVLNEGLFKKVDILQGERLVNTSAFEDFKKDEIYNVKGKCQFYLIRNKLPRYLTKSIILNMGYSTLSQDEKSKIVDDYEFTCEDKRRWNYLVENTNLGFFVRGID